MKEIKSFKKWVEENTEFISAIQKKADEVHTEVNQRYDCFPYIHHLNMVFQELVNMEPYHKHLQKQVDAYVECMECVENDIYKMITFAAYFHDSIEDARLTYNDVMKIANSLLEDSIIACSATEIVYALTNEKGRNRAERANDKYYEGIRDTFMATYVKLADRLANMSYSHITKSRMLQVYRIEMDHFTEAIGCTDVLKKYIDEWYKTKVFENL